MIHHRKIDATPILPRRNTKNNKMRSGILHFSTDTDSDVICPLHQVPYKLYKNNRPTFKGYDAHGNKIVEPSGYSYYRCWHCIGEGIKSNIPVKTPKT